MRVALLVLVLLSGCGSSSHRRRSDPLPPPPPPVDSIEETPDVSGPSEPGSPAPRRSMTTPEGVLLSYPVWVDMHPTKKAEMLAEIRTVAPEPDTRIDSAYRGVPSGTTLVILDPGAYYAPYSPTGLAAGEWRAPTTLYVAWRGGEAGKLLPALNHELRHMLTSDPLAGH
jgi:hypothetical protein